MTDPGGSTEAPEGVARAFAALDHPMNYADSAFIEQRPANAEERQAYLYDRAIIEDLISDYNYGVDASVVKTHTHKTLDSLFTNDAEVVFPHGKHQGNAGLGEWLLLPVSALHRISVSESYLWHVERQFTVVSSTYPQTTASNSNLAL